MSMLLGLEHCRFDRTAEEPVVPYLDRAGMLNYNRFSMDPTREGLPAKEVTLPVEAGGRMVGRFVLASPALAPPVSLDRLLTAMV